ncbi:hexokinase-2 isoform X2 [Nematostella vectensis]|uniref:hexokinase-2 isoform X2 n=1 Tax=Nematostella vectensis TaxID=45351 RepID=UPI00138FB171|nr:hexokinase-2 isoform X2 [Nematostella vectensis]
MAQEILKQYDMPKSSLEQVMKLLEEDMDNGLSADPKARENSPIKMLPTYVRRMPDGSESGDFLALDLGGTNFRVLLVQVLNGKVHMESEIFPLDQTLMTSDSITLFDYIADCITLFVKKKSLQDKTLPLGFTFSFPVQQLSLTSGLLIRWTKGFSAGGVEGEDVVRLLKDALHRKNSHSVDVVALVNDTTGTMMACGFDDRNVIAGLILGTGTNACYMESLDNVKKWNEERGCSNEVIINTEWGAFGDSGVLNWIITEHDKKIDVESINPGQQVFEKMISGMYLGELARHICMDLIHRGLLLNGIASNKLKTKGSFLTKFVSDIESGDENKLQQVLKELDVKATARDQEILRHICTAVSKRAARLASAGLATIVKKTKAYNSTIAIDGTLFKKHPKFKPYMQEALKELLPDSHLKLMLSEDGSGKGAALIAAVAAHTKSH